MAAGHFMPRYGASLSRPPLLTEFRSTDSPTFTAPATSVTFTLSSVGAMSRLVVGILSFNGAATFSALVVGGKSASLLGQVGGISLWLVDNPTGSPSATITGANIYKFGWVVWGVEGLQDGYSVDFQSSSATPGRVTVEAQAGGAVFAMASPGNGANGTTTWSGASADVSNGQLGSTTRRYNAARSSIETNHSREVVATYSVTIAGRMLAAVALR